MRLVITRRNSGVINTQAERAGTIVNSEDTYRERLLKYVPVETLVLYVAVYGSAYAVLASHPYFPFISRWILILAIIATPLWLWNVEGVTDRVQLAISTFGFVVWTFAFGVVPVFELPWYNPVAAALFLPVYIFGTPLADGMPERW